MTSSNYLLEIDNLDVSFWSENGLLQAVKNVSFQVDHRESVAIVGESGSGKSVTAESILKLHQSNTVEYNGSIRYQERDLLNLKENQLRAVRGKQIAMIFQDPENSLNPSLKIGNQMIETIRLHLKLSKEEAKKRALEVLSETGISDPERIYYDYPNQLSGGMQQRVMIALAISCHPKLIIADEPTTALDVTLQAKILKVLKRLKEDYHSSILFITHDLGVVAEIADRVIVMYAGEVVEIASVNDLFKYPKHPYTRSLLRSIPHTDRQHENRLYEIKGSVPSLQEQPKEGCRFSQRISWMPTETHEKNPILHEISPGHFVRCSCWKYFDRYDFKNKESSHEFTISEKS